MDKGVASDADRPPSVVAGSTTTAYDACLRARAARASWRTASPVVGNGEVSWENGRGAGSASLQLGQ
jgi:hypothetical protein